MPDKPDRTPWDRGPYVDPRAATEKAITAAQSRRVDPKSPVVQSYARKAFEDEIAKVKNAPGPSATSRGERQNTLFPAACNLYELVAAGAVDETEAYNALRDACRDNQLEQDDGEKSVTDTLRNARRRGFDNPRDLSGVGTKTKINGFTLNDEPLQSISLDDITTLERGFWLERESLQQIYLAALSRMCSPWAVLAHCAARTLALVRPHCRLPAIIGGPGSLNWFAAIAAESGGGKGSAAGVARELINQEVQLRNLGSGEGLIDAYTKPDQLESILFMADEIDTMTALTQRSGNTLASVLRSGFSGETLGFSYRTTSSTHLQSHTYRLTLVVSVQPAQAGALLDDKYSGTLQRFMWFPGKDNRVTTETPTMPTPLILPEFRVWNYPRELQIPYDATELIKDARARDMRGEQDALDGHALFIREKLAYALTVLDGRDEMSEDDWRLSGVVSRISDHTRKWVAAELIRITEEKITEEGRLHGVKQTAANDEQTYRNTQRLRRIAIWVLSKIGPDGITHRELLQAVASRDRSYLPAALEKLEQAGRIEKNKARWMLKRDA